eukprot:2530641-Alexandrium_andersonii.AAC.1
MVTSVPHPTTQQQGHYIHVDCLPKPFGDQLTLNAASDFDQNDLQTIMVKLREPDIEDQTWMSRITGP